MKKDQYKQAYDAQMEEMSLRARSWMKEHGGTHPVIQWNQVGTALFLTTIHDAIKKNFVVANKSGFALIEHITKPYKADREPTTLMIKAVIDAICKQKKTQ